MLKDQKELLSAFNAHGVEYLVVGGHAVNAHGVPRTTKDLDVFIRPEPANAEKVFAALLDFGAPMSEVAQSDFCGDPRQIFQIGVEPSRVDVLQDIGGIPFDAAWQGRVQGRIDEELTAPFISRDDLIAAKRNVARARDLADVEELLAANRVNRKRRKLPGAPAIELLNTPQT